MTEIRLHNSATREKEIFAPEDPRNVRMYVCGPTVYDRAHIGNARPAVVFDVLFRLLRHRYGEEHVTYVRNITDIDDKIMARAKERGVSIGEITAETTAWYRDDMAALGCLPPTHEPRATEFVPEMIAMIKLLVAKGNAYVTEGHVLFEVATWPEYGGLSGRSTDDMIAGARSETAPGKRSLMDFVLWKPSAADQPGWDSPWGRGRPGWHIECSAMASKLLGETFDIHGGGGDLMFPHHENEIAQSCCAAPDSGFARVWMHNGMINVDGRKMSKSLGNFFTVREKMEEGLHEEVIRYLLLSTHYRQQLDWTDRRVDEARTVLNNWANLKRDLQTTTSIDGWREVAVDSELVDALSDDLNTSVAFRRLQQLADAARLDAAGSTEAAKVFVKSLNWLGFTGADINARAIQKSVKAGFEQAEMNAVIEALLDDRATARANRDFARADEIRKRLDEAGIVVIDNQGGPSEWRLGPLFDPERLEALK